MDASYFPIVTGRILAKDAGKYSFQGSSPTIRVEEGRVGMELTATRKVPCLSPLDCSDAFSPFHLFMNNNSFHEQEL